MPRIAAVQMTSGLDVAKNLHQATALLTEAAQAGAGLVVLPEVFALISNDKDKEKKLAIAENFGVGPLQEFLAQQAARHKIWLIGGSIPIKAPVAGKTYNTTLVYNPAGEQVARYDKIHLFDVTVKPDIETYEESASVAFGEKTTVVDTPFGKVGLAICYDIRFPELFRVMVEQGAEIFAVPTAFTVNTGKAHWEVLMRARAIENFCYVIGACQSGLHETGRQTYGHSLIIDPWGTVLASLPCGQGVITADIDLVKLHKIREDFPSLRHRRVK